MILPEDISGHAIANKHLDVYYPSKFRTNNQLEDYAERKDVSRDPRIAICVVDQNNPYRMVTVRGRVVEQTIKKQLEKIQLEKVNETQAMQ